MYNDILGISNAEIELEWDDSKREMNIEKHGFDFVIASEIFEEFIAVSEDERWQYGERRYIASGLIRGKAMIMVYTRREEKIRIISLRRSNEKERKDYYLHRGYEGQNRLG